MKKIIVESFEPIRLDRYIRRIFPSATQGLIERYLRNGKIKVNAKKAKSNNRLQNGDEITLFTDLFQDNTSINKNFSEGSISLASKLLDEYLLLSTDEFIAINKPHDLAVQGGSKISLSVDDAISYLNMINGTNFKLVHRLDKATSGVLLIARGAINAAKLGQAFKDKLIQKTYYAVVCGRPKENQGIISNFIGKDKSGIFEIVKELKDGKKAETSYKILNENNDYSLIEFKPSTGRMHQLRIHSKILGCPILGDVKYGGSSCKRMMLHAKKIVIPQGIFGNEIVIETDLPEAWFIVK
jgi:23S rRNA pseudouridine955/2504/2580 synthase